MVVDPSTLPAVSIYLEHGDTTDESCRVEPLRLFEQFTLPSLTYTGYGELEVNTGVLIIPDDIERDWWDVPNSALMRRKVRHAVKLGYEFAPFEFDDYLDDVYEINRSKDERQGRPMTEAYRDRPKIRGRSPEQPCRRHRNGWFGVFRDGKLFAYTNVPQCGEMMLFSMILGHGDHMDDGIMYLLICEAVKLHQARSGTSYAVYYLMDSGTEGLRFFKRKMGFAGYLARWELRSRDNGIPAREQADILATSVSPVSPIVPTAEDAAHPTTIRGAALVS